MADRSAGSGDHPWSFTWLGTDRLLARRIARPVARFLEIEAASGLLLLAATVIALIWANSGWSHSYTTMLNAHLVLDAGPIQLSLTLLEFVNDGLMAVFFFVVGLEIKRELVKGELSDRRAAALPIIAAVGGICVPALIYLSMNAGTSASNGWGIPIATDIAFAVGVVALLGSRVPVGLKLFLLALAVVDDLGAIAVIAVFYSDSIDALWLLGALLIFVVILILQRLRVWYIPIYVVLGTIAWYCMFKSGVHATVAGVVLGFLAPARPLRDDLDANTVVADVRHESELAAADVQAASFLIKETVSVGERLLDRLHPWSSFVIIPLFALCNAGIPLTMDALQNAANSSVTWGVGVGLVVGKTVGVFVAASLAIRFGIARRPRGVSSLHLLGISMAAGIGFTVAIFVTGLAFTTAELADDAKVGILGASLVAALLAAAVLHLAAKRAGADELAIEAAENAELFAPTD